LAGCNTAVAYFCGPPFMLHFAQKVKSRWLSKCSGKRRVDNDCV